MREAKRLSENRMHRRLIEALPPLLAAIVAACSSSQGSGFGAASHPQEDAADGGSVVGTDAASKGGAPNGGIMATDASGGPPTDAGTSPPSSFDVAKTYAGAYAAQLKFRKVLSLNGGALGSFNALAAFYMTLQLTVDTANKVVSASANECHVDLTGTGTSGLMGAALQLPDVVLTTTHLDAAVFSASTAGSTTSWAISEIHGPIGWHWTSPSDAMPTSSSDPRIFDQDMDGNPGVTLHDTWSGMDYPLYVVQTQRDVISGTVGANGTLTGTTVDTTAMNVIGNTNALSGATLTWAPDSNTADNAVRLVRTQSLLTCSQLAAQMATLFP